MLARARRQADTCGDRYKTWMNGAAEEERVREGKGGEREIQTDGQT